MNSNPQPAVNSFEASPFNPAFYIACNWSYVIAPLSLTSHFFTTSSQSLHNFCCTSPQSLLYLTTIFAVPHYKSTAPHHNLCLHLTTVFAAPHHDLCCTSPHIRPHHDLLHLTTNFTAPTNSNMAYRNPTPALQKLVVVSSN